MSQNPSRFFFYPNPYLLSPLLNHKELLLKISKFEANYFWNNPKNQNEKKNIHSFLWLNLIDRKNEKETVQIRLFPWWPLTKNEKIPITADWVVTIVD